MSNPWNSDRPLDAVTVLRLAHEQFPRLGALAARPLGAGWDFEVYAVETAGQGTWALRFPRRREEEQYLPMEVALLELLGPRLPLAVPRYELLGEPAALFPYRFGGYRLVPGRPAPEVALAGDDVRRAGVALGRCLRAVHALDPARAREAGLVERPRDPARMAARVAEQLERARPVFPPALLAAAAPLLARVPGPIAGPFVPVHNDLTAGHILTDASGQPCALIDWSDAAIGDPASDYTGVLAWLGEPGLEAALAERAGHTDETFRARVRWSTAAVAVLQGSFAAATGDAPGAAQAVRALERSLGR